MKGVSDLVGGMHSLKQAKEHFESFSREMGKQSFGYKLAYMAINKIDFVSREIVTFPHFPSNVSDALKIELESDHFIVPSITEKMYRLSVKQRELIEMMIEAMLNGEEISFIDKP